MGNTCCLLLGLAIGVFVGLLIASFCAVSKLADEETPDFSKEVVGNIEDDGK
jgi:hypothetical protein